MNLDHSGVAGEPEATTKEASESPQNAAPTRVPVPDPVGPVPSILAGQAAITHEMVEAFVRSAWPHPDNMISAEGPIAREIRAGLAAVAPLIEADTLLAAARRLMVRRRGLFDGSSEWDGLFSAEVALKHRAHRLQLGASGPAYPRADELEARRA